MIILCLICHEELSQQMSWSSFLLIEPKACDDCYQSLKKIQSPTCPRCFRPQENDHVCQDCQAWENDPQWKNILQKNLSVFEYNDSMKELLATFKFRGDAALVEVFQKDFLASYKASFFKEKIDFVIPIPLSPERLYERGFNQAKLLANFLPLPQIDILTRTHHEKQSKKSRQERITASNVFSIVDSSKIMNKKILLIDDIYTTGSTLRHAAKVLKDNGTGSIFSFTLIRS
ncbi:ComF family protein [Metabacillus sp. YM-086]|uniref:ComF family protein n=1 Tax=Metabacillus sp. YM-086 TaxID=3341729 RepID=UPI003A848649